MSINRIKGVLRPLCLVVGGVMMVYPMVGAAGRFQPFNGISYRNPAELTLFVRNAQFIVGDDRVDPNVNFNGSVRVPNPLSSLLPAVTTNGRSGTVGIYNLPYGRMAARVKRDSPLIFDVDVTEPFAINISYPTTSPVRYAGTAFKISTVDVSPIVAYQFQGALSKLAVGGGIDFMYMWATFNSTFPTPIVALPPTAFGRGQDSIAENNLNGKTVGWHAGALYHVLKGSFIGLTYFSTTTEKLAGKSTYTYPNSTPPRIPVTNQNNDLHSKMKLPATVILNWLQLFNPIWKAEFSTSFTGWGRLQQLTLNDVAGPANTLTANLNYQNTWRYTIRNFVNVTPKWMLTQVAAYEVVPSSRYNRTALVPSSNSVVLGVGAEYRFIPSVGLMVNYNHVFFPKDVPIYNTSTTGRLTNGESNASANVVGLRLTVDIT